MNWSTLPPGVRGRVTVLSVRDELAPAAATGLSEKTDGPEALRPSPAAHHALTDSTNAHPNSANAPPHSADPSRDPADLPLPPAFQTEGTSQASQVQPPQPNSQTQAVPAIQAPESIQAPQAAREPRAARGVESTTVAVEEGASERTATARSWGPSNGLVGPVRNAAAAVPRVPLPAMNAALAEIATVRVLAEATMPGACHVCLERPAKIRCLGCEVRVCSRDRWMMFGLCRRCLLPEDFHRRARASPDGRGIVSP